MRILTIALIILTLLGTAGCDSGSSGTTSGNSTEEIEGTIQECGAIYTKYILCTENCEKGGLCLEGCVEFWYDPFLECCEEFDGQIECLTACFNESLVCFEASAPQAHDDRAECFLEFSDCTNLCPAPIAQTDSSQ